VENHKEFISLNFNRFIENGIYPLTSLTCKEKTKHGTYQQVTLEQYNQSFKKKEEKSNVRKYLPLVKKKKSQKYKFY
jgi:hypothetical protein